MERLVALTERLKQYAALQIFTIYLRYLIGGAFVIAAIGMGKLSGRSIVSMDAPIGDLMPIQQFFRVMADSGLYWKFIGWFQIVCGVMLMTQRYAKAGALLFFGMILNIFVITVSYHFRGTPIVTGLMTLAATYLLVWDIRSLQFIFIDPSAHLVHQTPVLKIHDVPYWSILGIIMAASIFILAIVTTFNPLVAMLTAFALGSAGLLIFFALRTAGLKKSI